MSKGDKKSDFVFAGCIILGMGIGFISRLLFK